MTNNSQIPEIVKRYRKEHGRSLRAFAENLSEITGVGVSYQSIKNWEDGTHKPSFDSLLEILYWTNSTPEIWQHNFANECIAALIRVNIPTPTEEA